MSSQSQERTPTISEAKFDHVVDGLTANGYQETDMQYNIGRLDGQSNGIRMDLVNPDTRDRVLITLDGSDLSEAMISETLGHDVMLGLLERSKGVSSYAIPRGARLLSKVLEAAPYKPDYMAKLTSRRDEIQAALAGLDENSFGITDDQLVLSHNGESDQDDVHICIVPPLKAPNVVNAMYSDPDISKLNKQQRVPRLYGVSADDQIRSSN
jgi:hypothetical protein